MGPFHFSHSATCSRWAQLDGRTRHGAVAAKNTAITLFGLETRVACLAVVKVHASICAHGFDSALATLRASDDRLQNGLPARDAATRLVKCATNAERANKRFQTVAASKPNKPP